MSNDGILLMNLLLQTKLDKVLLPPQATHSVLPSDSRSLKVMIPGTSSAISGLYVDLLQSPTHSLFKKESECWSQIRNTSRHSDIIAVSLPGRKNG